MMIPSGRALAMGFGAAALGGRAGLGATSLGGCADGEDDPMSSSSRAAMPVALRELRGVLMELSVAAI